MPLSASEPVVVLVFGTNCVGKSTVGRALAGRIERCAFIEIDELRYMVVEGLVAFSGGAKPWEHPEEYARQCSLGVRNAVGLARRFAEEGFSSVIDGLDDGCLPGSNWAESQFPDLHVLNVTLVCDEATLENRLNERSWRDDAFLKSAREQLAWYRANGSLFDCLADTTETEPEAAAELIAGRLFR